MILLRPPPRNRCSCARPNAWAQRMERQAKTMMKAGELTEQHWLIAQNLERVVDGSGARERILKRLCRVSYGGMFLKKFIFLYVVTLPIGFVATFAWWSIPVVMLVFTSPSVWS